jgi:benzoylformate decarboxylase
MRRSGADALLQAIEGVGCRYLFGLPGTTVSPLLDRLLEYPRIEYVLTKHESAAIAMAEGYARVTGQPAVVSLYMVVGLANAISMIYNAHKARVPLVVLVSQQDLALRLGSETVVDGDQLHLVQGITRHAAEVPLADRLGEQFVRAHKQAAGPLFPGPTLLSIPRDVLLAETTAPTPEVEGFRLSSQVEPPAEAVGRAAELLVRAEHPLVISGSQVASHGAIGDLTELAELLALPVTYEHFFNDRISFPRQHWCSLGQFRATSPWVSEADAVLAIGCRLHHELNVLERPRVPRAAKIIQVNLEPEQLAMKHPTELALLGDARSTVRALRRAVAERLGPSDRPRLEARRARLAEHWQRARQSLEDAVWVGWDDFPMKPWRVIRELDEEAGHQARIVTELSANTGCFYEFFGFRRPELTHSSSGCALGWGIGAAAGMKMAEPDVLTIACVGDGAFLFGVQTLWTLANYHIPVVVVVFNNGGYYSTRLHTERLGGLTQRTGRYVGGDMTDDPTDCARIAEGFGVRGERVREPSAFRPALRRALESNQPYVIDVLVQRVDFRPMG